VVRTGGDGITAIVVSGAFGGGGKRCVDRVGGFQWFVQKCVSWVMRAAGVTRLRERKERHQREDEFALRYPRWPVPSFSVE
jgi:hypothetical protein